MTDPLRPRSEHENAVTRAATVAVFTIVEEMAADDALAAAAKLEGMAVEADDDASADLFQTLARVIQNQARNR